MSIDQDRGISKLYQSIPKVEPNSVLDKEIRDLAEREIFQKPVIGRSRGWWNTISAVAGAVLIASVTLKVYYQDRADQIDFSHEKDAEKHKAVSIQEQPSRETEIASPTANKLSSPVADSAPAPVMAPIKNQISAPLKIMAPTKKVRQGIIEKQERQLEVSAPMQTFKSRSAEGASSFSEAAGIGLEILAEDLKVSNPEQLIRKIEQLIRDQRSREALELIDTLKREYPEEPLTVLMEEFLTQSRRER